MLLMHSDSNVLAEDVGEEGAATIGEERGIQGCAAVAGKDRLPGCRGGEEPKECQLMRRNARQTLWPPNPKELESTTLSVESRA